MVRIVVEGEPFWLMSASRRRWVSIFQNLIGNGIVYNQTTAPLITFTFEDFTIRISDNGIGIPSDRWEWVFDIFSRIGAEEDGSGVGLYTVRKFVRFEGGQIEIEKSEMGVGTTFLITIPGWRIFAPPLPLS